MSDQTNTAYEYIREKILTNEFKPSQKLVESQLSESVGVSRNTIKLALLRLEKDRLVEIEKNRGAVVKSFTLEEVLNYFEIREYLERLIVRSAAKHITDKEVEKLTETLSHMRKCIDENNLEHYSELNKKFHNIIYSASRNQQAVEFVLTIKTQLLRYHFRTILVPGRTSNSINEHTRIFEALRNRDLDEAEKAIQVHISHVRKTIEEFYQYLI